jgi:hypothetical protein
MINESLIMRGDAFFMIDQIKICHCERSEATSSPTHYVNALATRLLRRSSPQRQKAGKLHHPYTMAIFIFFTATTWAGVISANFILNPNRGCFLQFAHILHGSAISFTNQLGF